MHVYSVKVSVKGSRLKNYPNTELKGSIQPTGVYFS